MDHKHYYIKQGVNESNSKIAKFFPYGRSFFASLFRYKNGSKRENTETMKIQNPTSYEFDSIHKYINLGKVESSSLKKKQKKKAKKETPPASRDFKGVNSRKKKFYIFAQDSYTIFAYKSFLLLLGGGSCVLYCFSEIKNGK